jgi:hypothetical protein
VPTRNSLKRDFRQVAEANPAQLGNLPRRLPGHLSGTRSIPATASELVANLKDRNIARPLIDDAFPQGRVVD